MKKLAIMVALMATWMLATAQVGINTDNSAPDNSAMLDVKSNNRGFLPPRMTHASIDVIVNPSEGLIIYCTDCGVDGDGAFFGFIHGKWLALATCEPPLHPTAGNLLAGIYQITWNWNMVPGATGYKWNNSLNFKTATDIGATTTRTDTGLVVNTAYQRYVWAYNSCGSSSALTLTSNTLSNFCGLNLTISHVAGAVAPVSKSTSYGTVTNIAGEPWKCWITSNLGSDHQATAVNDATEASAGWYWQFNRKKGYKHDGTTLTPSWTITLISENSDWQQVNDPCFSELGSSWRIPTYSEWLNVVNAGNWTTWNGPWNSGLKMHAAGYLDKSTGALGSRGTWADLWSGTQSDVTQARDMNYGPSGCELVLRDKAYGFPLRCLKDTNCTSAIPSTPSFVAPTCGMNGITWKWGSVACSSGYKWNASDNYASATDMGTATTKTELGLVANTAYTRYVWAYNASGHSAVLTMTINTSSSWVCGIDSLTTNHHVANGAAPVEKLTHYGTVKGIPGDTSLCWITSNLGADHQATAVTDNTEASAGWYWQFNRKQGHKYDVSPTPGWTTTAISENSDWTISNDPCHSELGGVWHIPSYTEWFNVTSAGGWNNYNGPWNSVLKLHCSGWVNATGTLKNRGNLGVFWTSSQNDNSNAKDFHFDNGSFVTTTGVKAEGFTLRCIKGTCNQSLSAPVQGTNTAGTNGLIWNWNTVTGATGYKWNTTNNFSTAVDMGLSTSQAEVNLTCNTAYNRYIWAYNLCDTSSMTSLTGTTLPCSNSFTCGTDSLHIVHAVSNGVAPINKPATYSTVTNIPGELSKCWIASNLGSDHKASAVTDNTEASAGWYWQFNQKQGRKYDGTPTPAWTITAINENSDWLIANDPCHIELGGSWRIPSNTEWLNVTNAGGWTNYIGPWNSALKLHCGGWVNTAGALQTRGSTGVFWSSVQNDNTTAKDFHFDNGSFVTTTGIKAEGFPLRCLTNCTSSPSTPTSGTNVPSSSAIQWHWNPVNGASGYKWSTTDNYSSATDIGLVTSKLESGLTCNSNHTRYIWAYNSCGNSTALTMNTSTLACGVFTCDLDTLTINHQASNGVSPVDKTAHYPTVSTIPGTPGKCWITSNLGADHQAGGLQDATEASAGWYWQFDHKQGYKNDGSIVTPAWTITSMALSNNWLPANDPCSHEMGGSWRLPTASEWNNVLLSSLWIYWWHPWDSDLKLHTAGFLKKDDGSIQQRGTMAMYWSSTVQLAPNSNRLEFRANLVRISLGYQAEGYPVRCIQSSCTGAPSIPNSAATGSSPSSLTWNWTLPAGATGSKWSATNDYTTATDMGVLTTATEVNLICNTGYTRFVWAYNECGHSLPLTLAASTLPCATLVCGTDSVLVVHSVANQVAPVNKTTKYATVTGVPGEPAKCWITKNLGADWQATSLSDVSDGAAGWYWQFNMKKGYQWSGGSLTPSAWYPYTYASSDWQPENDPCSLEMGSPWRIPTQTEWGNVISSWANASSAWNSTLKLHNAGYLNSLSGVGLAYRGDDGFYWSRTQVDASDGNSYRLLMNTIYSWNKNIGFSVRCIK